MTPTPEQSGTPLTDSQESPRSEHAHGAAPSMPEAGDVIAVIEKRRAYFEAEADSCHRLRYYDEEGRLRGIAAELLRILLEIPRPSSPTGKEVTAAKDGKEQA